MTVSSLSSASSSARLQLMLAAVSQSITDIEISGFDVPVVLRCFVRLLEQYFTGNCVDTSSRYEWVKTLNVIFIDYQYILINAIVL